MKSTRPPAIGKHSAAETHQRSRDRSRLRQRPLQPSPELLEDRTLLAGPLPAGSLDPSFNSAGWVTAQVGSAVAGGAGALQPDGKIVLAGSVTGSGGVQATALIRYLPTGRLDNTFGPAGTGIVVLDPASKMYAAGAIAVISDPGQPDDGKIMVTGSWADSATNQTGVALARFNRDGSLDKTGFGNGGIVLDDQVPNAQGMAAALEPDGDIVIGGVANTGTSAQPVDTAFVERFSSSGLADPAFGFPGVDTPLLGGISSTLGGVALDVNGGDIVVAGKVKTGNASALIAVARLRSDGSLDPTFGSGGIVTADAGANADIESVNGVAIGPIRSVVVTGTAAPTASAPEDIFAARFDFNGNLDPAFNEQQVKLIDFQQSGRSNADFAGGVAVGPDGKIVIAGATAVPVPGQPGSVGPGKIALVRLNPDGTLDSGFGSSGESVTDLGTSRNPISSSPRSVLLQPDGNIVVTGQATGTGSGAAFAAFAVARYIGATLPGSGSSPAGAYVEDFSSDSNPVLAGLDSSGEFQHILWYNAQSQGPATPSDTAGSGWEVGAGPSGNSTALQLTGAADTITFPGLRADVHVGLGSVDVTAVADAFVTFVGDNGVYTASVGPGGNETVSAGESHVLQTDNDGNPTLELGPIREIILDSANAFFDNVKILAIPGQGPLDDFITNLPNTPTSIDVIGHATLAAVEAGLQLPLQLFSFTKPTLPGSDTWRNADQSVQYTPGQGQGEHPTDLFSYTVVDSGGKRATGTVYITIDTPPKFAQVQPNFSVTTDKDGWHVAHGTPGPLIGNITLSDAEGDALKLTLLDQALHGTVTLTQDPANPDHVFFRYDPPTIEFYQYKTDFVFGELRRIATGLTTTASALVGNDVFTLEASDGFTFTDYTVRFIVPDSPPTTAELEVNKSAADAPPPYAPVPTDFIVPENFGESYYSLASTGPFYDPRLDFPGLVHFAAPGVLWKQLDPDGDPMFAQLLAPPLHGMLFLNPDGSFNYTPQPGFVGDDSFEFVSSDGYQSSDPTTVNIHVKPGTAADPFQHALVLLDVHYAYQWQQVPANLLSGVFGRFSPSITSNSFVDIGTSDLEYPQNKILIQPDISFIFGGEPVVDVPDVTKAHQLNPNDFSDFSLFFNQDPTTLGLYVDRSDHPADGSLSDLVLLLFSDQANNPQRINVSLSYAVANSQGWLSNFASVELRIDPPPPPGPANQATVETTTGPVFVESPSGTSLAGVQSISSLPPGAPSDLGVPWLLSFTVLSNNMGGLPPGPVDVTITLPSEEPHYTTYYKYGHQTPGDAQHWYPFMYDPAKGHPTGARISNDPISGSQIIDLFLIDGALGDNDQVVNGSITDPGGPGFFTDPRRNLVASLYEDVLGRGPTDAELARWLGKLDRGESRLKLAQTLWDSSEHRRLQVSQWSIQFLGHAPLGSQEARWVKLLRRGAGEIAVQQAMLLSSDYRREHPTIGSFIAGLNHDALGSTGGPIYPAQVGRRRHPGPVSRDRLARQILTSRAAAAILAQRDATAFLGRPATAEETRAGESQLARGPTAPARIAERILASDTFYNFVNSALPVALEPIRTGRQSH
jgi:uncharacterized delta-60 repeat protein